jgi:16S rRNA (guanine527-N7)-methyltransferase
VFHVKHSRASTSTPTSFASGRNGLTSSPRQPWTRFGSGTSSIRSKCWTPRPFAKDLWLDLGSGGGFPGLVCAIAALETDPALRFELVDSDTRKCVFLREVARHTGLSVTVHTSRIEALPPRNASVISARALAPLSQLLPLALRHLAPGGICLFQKGAGHGEELESLPEGWQMEVDILPSVTSADSVILRIRNLSHAA